MQPFYLSNLWLNTVICCVHSLIMHTLSVLSAQHMNANIYRLFPVVSTVGELKSCCFESE